MAIKKYTNFEEVNNRIENEGKYIAPEDVFIVTKNEVEISEFGDCKYDVMEVSVYDVNNNLLPQKSGRNVSYIKSGDAKNYIYNITNGGGQKELAIDAEKLLNDIGFTNGIFKVNINFVRNRVGNDSEYNKVWIQEISPSREEIRILPLKTKDENINKTTNKEFENLIQLNKEFKHYKTSMLKSLDSFARDYLPKINDFMVNRFGNEFFTTFKRDFGISSFDNFVDRIFENFKLSTTYYLDNKYYDIENSNFGKPLATPTFEDCERYDYTQIKSEIDKILYKCVSNQIKALKRRSIEYQTLPKEFSVVQLQKSVQDNLSQFSIPITNRNDIYSPSLIQIKRAERLETPPPPAPIDSPVIGVIPIDNIVTPGRPYRPEMPPVVEDPIDLPIVPPASSDPIIREPEPSPPNYSGGGGLTIVNPIRVGDIAGRSELSQTQLTYNNES